MQINDKYAKLSEALYVAEHTAREEVKTRASINKILSLDPEQSERYKVREERERERQRERRLEAAGKEVHLTKYAQTTTI